MEYREALSFDDILLVPRFSNLPSRKSTDVSSCGYSMPLAMTPMDLITTPEMIDCFIKNHLLASVHRYFKTPEEQYDFIFNNKKLEHVPSVPNKYNIYFAVGSVVKHKEWIDFLYNNGIRKFLVDMAHGDTQACIDTVKYINEANSHGEKRVSIIAGNICTKSGFERLQEAGADYIRCGIGNGSICATRTNCAVGVPQFTALQDCASRKKTAKLISCGGVKYNGDIAKAIAAGADLVMCGKLFAGTDLAGGKCFDKNKKLINVSKTIMCPGVSIREGGIAPPPHEHELSEEQYRDRVHRKAAYKEYYGMASREARSGVLNYGSVEGVRGLVPYIGKTQDLLDDLKLNMEATLSYNGVKDWDELRRKVKIIRISNSAILESRTHVEGLE